MWVSLDSAVRSGMGVPVRPTKFGSLANAVVNMDANSVKRESLARALGKLPVKRD
jgi:hypothetical protein